MRLILVKEWHTSLLVNVLSEVRPEDEVSGIGNLLISHPHLHSHFVSNQENLFIE